MKMKRIIAFALAVFMLAGMVTVAASAEGTQEKPKTYNYVALGDSITAGYGLSEDSLKSDPALVITEELLANPIADAYPAVFGSYLAALGEEYGYEVNTTNLAACAYNTEDVRNTILTDGYVGQEASVILESYLGEGASEPLKAYHDIFVSRLKDADMVSLMLGINELSIGMLNPLLNSDNVILQSLSTSFSTLLYGYTVEDAVQLAIVYLAMNKDKITEETVVEAITTLRSMLDKPDELIDDAVDETKNIIDTIREINPDVDITILSQINVWGNSLICDGKEYNLATIAKDIMNGAIDIAKQEGTIEDKYNSLISVAADEFAYPMQALVFGKTLDPYIRSMNEKLELAAAETGSLYVDVYGIDNKLGMDPHPNAEQHAQIAGRMWETLGDFIRNKIDPAGYTITRISHPGNKPGEVDGLVPEGDRGTSYTWRMAQRGDDIYIATYRHLLNGVVNLLAQSIGDLDASWALTDMLTNGEFPKADDLADTASFILKYNMKTGEFSKVYTFRPYEQCRMVVNYEDMIYAGTFSSVLPDQFLFRIDEDDNVDQVIKTSESFSIRANCVYDSGNGNHLYFAGADENEVLDEGDEDCCKVAVWEKDADDDFVWNRVADYHDFYRYTRDAGMKNNTGCPVWELANHDGYIYAGMPYTKGFLIFRGRPAKDGEEANAYGWIWEEVVGETNGINNPGMAAEPTGHKDTNFSAIVSVYEFNGELYAFDFDQTIMAALAFISGGLSKVAGADVSLSQMVKPVYDTLHHTQTLWKLNDETGAFEPCQGFTDLMEGTCNEYVWRAQEHDGYMYVSTMDSAVLYNYMTWATNGYLCTMSEDQIKREIEYIRNFIELIKPAIAEKSSQRLTNEIERLEAMINELCGLEINEEDINAFMLKYKSFKDQIKTSLENISSLIISDVSESDMSDDEIAAVGCGFMDADDEFDTSSADAETLSALDKIKACFSETAETANEKLSQIKDGVATAMSAIEAKVDSLIDSVDWEGIRMYLEINEIVKNDHWGCDIVRTKDGVNFEVVTDNGFGDRYNYGSAAFLSTENGLFIGTCNPFYGGQLYLLSTNTDEPIETPDQADADIIGDADGDGDVTIMDVTYIQCIEADIFFAGSSVLKLIDINKDGIGNVIDACLIQRWICNIKISYIIGKRF